MDMNLVYLGGGLNSVPANSYVEGLIPSMSKCECICETEVHYDFKVSFKS